MKNYVIINSMGEKNMERIKVAIIEPTVIHLGKTIDLKKELEYYIKKPYKETEAFENVYFIYSEVQDKTLKKNKIITNENIYGTVIAVGKQGNKYISLNKEQLVKLDELFRQLVVNHN